MNRARFAGWFRRRMLPLVISTSFLVAISAPLAYWMEKQHDLADVARTDAARVAKVIQEAVQHRPRFWRYDAAKLGERLAAEGLDQMPVLVVQDDRGIVVPIGPPATENQVQRLLWGRAPVLVGEDTVATVWVGTSVVPALAGTIKLAILFLVLALLLGLALYRFPMRAISVVERRVNDLIEKLARTLPENERQRIARELHDGVGQALTAARLHLLALRRSYGNDASVATIARQIDESIDEVRRATTALAPPALQEDGLGGAIERHCQSFAELTGLAINCQVQADPPQIRREVEAACYRIAQEALANVVRHAHATEVWVRMEHTSNGIELEVADDGKGFIGEPLTGAGLGFMRDRAAILGGSLVLGSRSGGGARVFVTLPDTGAKP